MPQVTFHIYVCTEVLAGSCTSSLLMAMAMGLMHNMWQDDIENCESERRASNPESERLVVMPHPCRRAYGSRLHALVRP